MAPAALALVYRDEAAGAAAGLDWTRSEQAYGRGSDHSRDEDEDWSDYDDPDWADDSDYDDFDYTAN